MRTLETQLLSIGRVKQLQSPIEVNEIMIKDKTNEILSLSQMVTKNLEKEFSDPEKNNNKEVNILEEQLASLFGKNIYKNMINLNKKQELTMENVLSGFEVLQV